MSNDKLPDGWKRVKFGDVVRNVNENSRDLEADGIDRVVGLDHLDPGSLRLVRWDNLTDLPDGTTFTRKFKPGHVLFGKRRAYQRKVAVPDFHGVCSGDILVFEPADKRMLTEFLPYVVQSDGFFDHALGTSAGSLSPRTKWAELAKYEFALPPIDEQRRIVKLISSADALEDCLKRLSESTLTAERAVAVVPSDEEMACQRLGDVCEILVGHPFKSADFVASGVRLARCSNVGPGFLRWDEKGTVYLSAKDAKDHLQFELRADDILIAMDGTFTAEGFKAAVVEASDTPSLLVQRVARLRAVDGGLSAAALLVVVRSSAFRRWLLEGTTQTTVAHVSGRLISDFPIPSDWRESESAVAGSYLKSIDAVSDAVANERTQTRVLRKELLERLLSGNTDHVH